MSRVWGLQVRRTGSLAWVGLEYSKEHVYLLEFWSLIGAVWGLQFKASGVQGLRGSELMV